MAHLLEEDLHFRHRINFPDPFKIPLWALHYMWIMGTPSCCFSRLGTGATQSPTVRIFNIRDRFRDPYDLLNYRPIVNSL